MSSVNARIACSTIDQQNPNVHTFELSLTYQKQVFPGRKKDAKDRWPHGSYNATRSVLQSDCTLNAAIISQSTITGVDGPTADALTFAPSSVLKAVVGGPKRDGRCGMSDVCWMFLLRGRSTQAGSTRSRPNAIETGSRRRDGHSTRGGRESRTSHLHHSTGSRRQLPTPRSRCCPRDRVLGFAPKIHLDKSLHLLPAKIDPETRKNTKIHLLPFLLQESQLVDMSRENHRDALGGHERQHRGASVRVRAIGRCDRTRLGSEGRFESTERKETGF